MLLFCWTRQPVRGAATVDGYGYQDDNNASPSLKVPVTARDLIHVESCPTSSIRNGTVLYGTVRYGTVRYSKALHFATFFTMGYVTLYYSTTWWGTLKRHKIYNILS
jgi:hypothetical protein